MKLFKQAAMTLWGILALAASAPAQTADTVSTPSLSVDTGPTASQCITIGEDRLDQKNYLGAAFQFERAIQKEPRNVLAYLKLAHAYIEMGHSYAEYFTKAEATYAKVADLVGRENVEYRKGIAELNLARWNVDDAVSIYEKLTAEYGDSCSYWLLLSEAQRMKGLVVQESEGQDAAMAQLDAAEKTVGKAREICPDEIGPVQALAQIKDTRKKYQEVVELYAGLLKQHPGNVDLMRGYAIAAFNARDWATAAQALQDLLKTDPRPEERLMLISALRKLDRLPEAEAQERIAREEAPKIYGPVELRPEDILREKLGMQPIIEQGVALVEKGQCDEAVKVWKELRTKVEAYLQDPQFKDAAEDLLVWLDRRILYAEGKCK